MRLWTATFDDGYIIKQPENDKYSKHDDNKEWNPSAFKDIQDYQGELTVFAIEDYSVSLNSGKFTINGCDISLEDEPLTDRKLIYYRVREVTWNNGVQTERIIKYAMGYEGKNNKGKIEKKVIWLT